MIENILPLESYENMIYGVQLDYEEMEEYKKVVIKFNKDNYSFLDIVNKECNIIYSMNIFEISNIFVEEVFHMKYSFKMIITMNDLRRINLFFFIKKEKDLFVNDLEKLLKYTYKYKNCLYSVKNLIRTVFIKSEINNIYNDYSISDLEKVLDYLNITLEEEEYNKLVKKTVEKTKTMTQFDFKRIFKVLLIKEEFESMFKNILELDEYEEIGKAKISLNEFIKFSGRKDPKKLYYFFKSVCLSNVFDLDFDKYNDNILDEEFISFYDFCCFLFSPLNNLEKSFKQVPLDKPLTQFFIKSSYYSYEKGHLKYGNASKEEIIEVIANNVRFISLDIKNGEHGPVICYFKNFQESIDFEETIKIISDKIFIKTDLPFFINLNIKCDEKERNEVAEILQKYFGTNLYTVSQEELKLKKFPLMKEFMGKVLIICNTIYPSQITKTQKKIIQEEALGFSNCFFKEKFNIDGLNTVFGFSEMEDDQVKEISKDLLIQEQCIKFHEKYFTCVYYENSVDDMEKFSPVDAWLMGIQCSGVNYQNNGIFELYNKAMFGNEGMVCKNDIYYKNVIEDRVNCEFRLEIEVISCQVLQFNNKYTEMYPFVEIYVDGQDKDDNEKENSEVCKNNLFHCVFENQFQFDFYYPELAFLIIKIKDARKERVIKSNVIKFTNLKEGFGSLELYDNNNDHDGFSYILMNVKKIDLLKKKDSKEHLDINTEYIQNDKQEVTDEDNILSEEDSEEIKIEEIKDSVKSYRNENIENNKEKQKEISEELYLEK